MSKRFLARFTLPLAGLALVASYAGCGGADENNDGIGSGSGAGTASGGAGGEGGNVFGTGVGGGTGGDDSCASVEQEATLNSRPVDIIVAIDNSGSMGGEIEEVEVQMAKTFASILDGAVPAIDYRVIMVADHGSFNGSSICISQPLGLPADADNDGHCDVIPNEPSDNPPKFFHHSRDVDDFYDFLQERIRESDRRWFFLVNLNQCEILPAAWVRYAYRGKRLNEAGSLGSARFAAGSETAEDIRLRAETQGFRPNIRNTREEALGLIEEMRAELLQDQ